MATNYTNILTIKGTDYTLQDAEAQRAIGDISSLNAGGASDLVSAVNGLANNFMSASEIDAIFDA